MARSGKEVSDAGLEPEDAALDEGDVGHDGAPAWGAQWLEHEGELLDGESGDEAIDEQDLLAEDNDEHGPVLEMNGGAQLARRRTVSLEPDRGEWVKEADDDVGAARQAREVRDLYQAFVGRATSLPRLSEDQERALGRKVRDYQDQSAAKTLVVHNLRLAIKMAHQYRRAWTNIMDLVQEASAGMAIAAQRWDPDQGTRFGTYAVYWIRAQLTKFLMTHGRVIHTGTTRAGRKLYFQLPRIRRELLAEGKQPTIDAIAERVGEDRAEVERIVARLDGREASLSAPIGDDEGGGALGDLIAADEGDPEDNAAKMEMGQLVGGLVKRYEQSLSDERDIAVWREHLMSEDPVSLVDLGRRYGVSKQRMGQLATRLKRGFRRHVIEELGPHTQLSWLFQQD
ncbi:MAG: sigma-70 family RNA polymerase sigma factor [Myxococcota bacterium]